MSARPEALREATAKEALGEVPSYRDARLPHKFALAVETRQDLDHQIKELEEDRDRLSKDILEMLARTGLKAVMVEGYKPTIVDQDRRSISAEKLLELGVPASVIEKATVVSHSVYLRVFDTAKSKVRGEEKRAGVVPVRKR